MRQMKFYGQIMGALASLNLLNEVVFMLLLKDTRTTFISAVLSNNNVSATGIGRVRLVFLVVTN